MLITAGSFRHMELGNRHSLLQNGLASLLQYNIHQENDSD